MILFYCKEQSVPVQIKYIYDYKYVDLFETISLDSPFPMYFGETKLSLSIINLKQTALQYYLTFTITTRTSPFLLVTNKKPCEFISNKALLTCIS